MRKSNESIVSRIVELRKKSGLTQNDVAARANISFRTYQRIECGEIAPRMDTLCEIVRIISPNPPEFFSDLFFEHKDCACLTDKQKLSEIHQNHPPNLPQPMLAHLDEINGIKRVLLEDFQRDIESVGYWEWNTMNGQWYWTPQMFEIYDISMTDPEGYKEYCQRIVPEDLERMQESLNLLIKKNQTYRNTHRIVSPKGRFTISSIAKRHMLSDDVAIIYGVAERVK